MRNAPFVACVGVDVDRVRHWVDGARSAGLRARAFQTASAAIHVAGSTCIDAVVADWSIGSVDAAFLAQRLRVALGSAAPPLVVVAGAIADVPDPSRFAAVIARAAPDRSVLDAITSAIARRRAS